jgi:cell division protein ZapA (FtsZ GTPase activity inhibitor)
LEQLLTIEIFGQPYTFETDSDLTKAKAVADVLVREVDKIESQQKKVGADLNKNTMLVIAALNIATENTELKQKHEKLIKTISRRAEQLIRSLDDDATAGKVSI